MAKALIISNVVISSENSTFAQLVPDESLGEESSVVNSCQSDCLIEHGARRGENLFHSFKQFNIGEGQTIYFTNPNGVQRIFTRVTGKSRSEILGKLGVEGTADLFLINPNSIIFGPNASLDIKGSFIATTANSVIFANGNQFSATSPSDPPILTVDIPIGLSFRQPEDSNITVRTTFLKVAVGETLALIGGDLSVKGGCQFSEGVCLNAPLGRIELGSVAEGQVSLQQVDTGWTFIYDNITNFRDITFEKVIIGTQLEEALTSDTVEEKQKVGDVQIQGRKILFTQGSGVLTDGISGGTITLTASDAIEFKGIDPASFLYSSFLVTGTIGIENAGNIIITSQKLVLQDGAFFAANSTIDAFGDKATGQAGNIIINATELVEMSHNSFLSTQTRASGNGGNLHINTRQLSLRDGSIISSSATSDSSGGNITINTHFLLAFPSQSFLGSDITANSRGGQGGAINIQAVGVYGLLVQKKFSFNSILNNLNEITAFSAKSPALNGTVTLITPNVDPSRGLIQFSTTIINPDTLIAQNPCNKQDESGLAITERGGLPVNILEDISPRAVEVELIAPVRGRNRKTTKQDLHSQKPEKIIPARGWIREKNGQILLTAYDPTLNHPQRQPQNPATCPTP